MRCLLPVLAKMSPATALSVLALALFSGCGQGGEAPTPPAAGGAPAARDPAGAALKAVEKKGEAAGTPVPAALTVDPGAGSITGKVTFTGTPPPMAPIRMDADPNCLAIHGDHKVFAEDVVVNKNKTLKNVFVFISKGLEGKKFPVPDQPVVFDQRGCRYEPHVFGIMAKQKVEILNSDATNHNVHFLPRKNREINIGMPQKNMKATKDLARPESPVKIKCEVHPWMVAWCHVLEHPYFSVTSQEGTYEIKNLPPGKYTLTAWHEKYGELKKEIEVAPKEAKKVDFEVKG